MTDSSEVFTSLNEAALYAEVTRQAIFLAIKKRELKAEKRFNGRQPYWLILKKDLDDYRAGKYHPEKRKFQGEQIINLMEKKWSVLYAAKTISTMLGRPINTAHIYYLLRTGQLRASRKGAMWVISPEDAEELCRKYGWVPNREKASV